MIVRLSRAAEADLTRLDDFLRPKSPFAADRLQRNLYETIARLARSPGIGRRRAEAPPGIEVRERVMRFGRGSYVIRYAIAPDVITILRIHHGREGRG